MAGNGKADPTLDLDHELPASDDVESQAGVAENQSAPVGAVDELTKLKAERDALYERLARLQA